MTSLVDTQVAVIFAPRGRDASIAASILAEVGIVARQAHSLEELVGLLCDEAAMVIVTEEALLGQDLRSLHDWVGHQPEWSDLPFILLTSQGGALERNPVTARYLEVLGNVTFLERPFQAMTFVSLAKVAARARHRQYGARKALETIRLGEQRLSLALSAGHLGAWSLEIAALQLEASPQCKAHYGRAPSEAFPYEELIKSIHPDDWSHVRARMEHALGGQEDYDVEHRCVWPDGQVKWVQVRGRADGLPGGRVESISGVSADITERKNAEIALQQSEERFRAAVNAVEGVMWTNNAVGEMRGEQPGWAKLTGQTREEYEGFGWASAVHPDDAQPTVEAWNNAVAKRGLFVFEHRLRLRNGAWGNFAIRAVPALQPDGSVREWVGVHTDITEQRTMERELVELAESLEERVALATVDLAASTNRLRSIFETSFQYFAELTPDGILLDANATSLSGIAAHLENVVGLPFWETPWFLGTPGAPDTIRQLVAQVASGEAARREIAFNLASGNRTFDLSMRPVKGVNGEVIALVYEAIDLTDRREAEEKLRQSQKLETIGQLTGGVAHDFNNLLTPIVGSLELLGSKLKGDERAERWASAGLQSAERARVLVNRLLSFARRQALEAKPVDVPELLVGMRDLISRSVGPTIGLQIKTNDNLPKAFVDANQLELSILNLCVNARDAMPAGGSITISVEADAQAMPFEGASLGDYVRISVADTGSGMTPETAAKAIEPFYTTKDIGKGTGLGLSMVHGLAGQLGGGLAIDSAVGHGTTITMWLPISTDQSGVEIEGPVEHPSQPTQAATVLVVDDEVLVRFATADTLRDAGYEVAEASSGTEAKRLLKEGLKPNILVTDQLMPDIKGSDLAHELTSTNPNMAVLIATGYADLPDVPYPLISKPFTSAQLIESVRNLVESNAGYP